MSGIAAPPEWALGLQLDPGPWRVLVGLWTFAAYNVEASQVVGPSRGLLAKRIGLKTTGGLHKQLSKLKELGWIREESGGRWGDLGLRLAWATPFESPGGDSESPGGSLQVDTRSLQVDTPPVQVERSPGGHSTGPGGHSGVSRWTGEGLQVETQTFQGPFKDQEKKDARAARHREIVAAQAELRRGPPRPADAVTPEHRSAVEAADLGAWAQELWSDRWLGSLGEAIAARGLTPPGVRRVLEAWTRQASGLTPAERCRVDAGNGSLPPRRGIWWARWGDWVATTLDGKPANVDATNSWKGAAAAYDPVAATLADRGVA